MTNNFSTVGTTITTTTLSKRILKCTHLVAMNRAQFSLALIRLEKDGNALANGNSLVISFQPYREKERNAHNNRERRNNDSKTNKRDLRKHIRKTEPIQLHFFLPNFTPGKKTRVLEQLTNNKTKRLASKRRISKNKS